MTFKKADGGKPRFGLIPPRAELEFVKVLTHGGDKYGDDNWKNCDNWGRYVDALGRHLSAYRMGERDDPESGLHHLAHLMCCAAFLLERELWDDDGLALPTDPKELGEIISEYTGITEAMQGDNGTGTMTATQASMRTDDPADILLPKDRFCRACD